MRKDPMPIVGLRFSVPCPVRGLRVEEDDARAFEFLIGVTPHVIVALRRSARRALGPLKPRMSIRRVVERQLDDDLDAPIVRGRQKSLEVVERSVVRMDLPKIGHIISIVTQGGRKEGEQPQTSDTEILDVIETPQEALEVADSVAVTVDKRADVQLVDDGIFVPERIGGA